MYGSVERTAFGFRYDETLYELRGVCETGGCQYDATGDRLVYYSLGERLQLHIKAREAMSQSLKWRYDTQTSKGYYQAESSVDDWMLRTTGGDAVGVGAYAMSRNGQWVIVELRDRGMARVHLATKQVKRISAPNARRIFRRSALADPGRHSVTPNPSAAPSMA